MFRRMSNVTHDETARVPGFTFRTAGTLCVSKWGRASDKKSAGRFGASWVIPDMLTVLFEGDG